MTMPELTLGRPADRQHAARVDQIALGNQVVEDSRRFEQHIVAENEGLSEPVAPGVTADLPVLQRKREQLLRDEVER